MTHGEKIAFNLHSRNDNNLRHLENGGFSFSSTPTKIIKLTTEDIAKLAKLSPDEKKVADAMHEYLNKIQKDKINERSVDLLGYEIARENDYFPIRTNYLDRFHDELMLLSNAALAAILGEDAA